MDGLLLAVILVLLLILLYPSMCEAFAADDEEGGDESFSSTMVPVSMVAFKSDDPYKTKYTMQWDGDEWGLNSAEKYYENLLYYNTGLSNFDPAGPGMFDDPAGAPPLPGMSEIERLGYEVLRDQTTFSELQQRVNDYQISGKNLSFAPAHMQDSMEDNV